MRTQQRQRGATLVFCLVFLAIFSALGVALTALSGTSLQVATNHSKVNVAFSAAESGLEVMRYWINRFVMPKTTPPADYFSTIVAALQADLQACGITNVVVHDDGRIPAVSLDAATGSSFRAQLRMDPMNSGVLLVAVTGDCGGLTRTIEVSFHVAPYEHPIFNYGMATRGALRFPQNPTLTAATSDWEADIYTESSNDLLAVQVVGNMDFDGDISIGNPLAGVDFQGDVSIAGETGQTAIDNHVHLGVDPVAFPAPDTQHFAPYAQGGPVLDPATMDLTKGLTLTNVTIPANTNPTFGGSVVIQGILLVESPNVVTFGHNVMCNGIIVGDGNLQSSGTDQLNFQGNFATGPYPAGEAFDTLRNEIGSSIIAPGFAASFAGNFSTIDGVIAVSGVHFAGNATATIRGTIINYGDSPTVVDGNIAISFDRASATKIPAGFDTHRVLAYNPMSYSMPF